MGHLDWVGWLFIGFIALSVVFGVTQVGKVPPRRTPGVAALGIVIGALEILGILHIAGVL